MLWIHQKCLEYSKQYTESACNSNKSMWPKCCHNIRSSVLCDTMCQVTGEWWCPKGGEICQWYQLKPWTIYQSTGNMFYFNFIWPKCISKYFKIYPKSGLSQDTMMPPMAPHLGACQVMRAECPAAKKALNAVYMAKQESPSLILAWLLPQPHLDVNFNPKTEVQKENIKRAFSSKYS